VNAGADLSSSGISIRDQFIQDAEVHALRECARTRDLRGEFAPARIGGQGAQQRREGIRGDFTCWLREPLLPMEQVLLRKMEELRLQLNCEAFLGLFELELHYAKYPPGSAYARHVDQPLGNSQRRVSLVLYLSSDWQRTDGGILRIHGAKEGGAKDGFIDIEPLGGRLVCFLTSGREHEVLEARCERLSISGWFRAREAH
jgi:SM-20-related protein